MSTIIKAMALQARDLFELPNGSVYETAHQGSGDARVQAHLWCAHSPDVPTGAPAMVPFPPEHEVGLLSHTESRLHVCHPGYVRAVFAQEMDRRHQELMSVVYANMHRANAATRQQARAHRPWWQKMFR